MNVCFSCTSISYCNNNFNNTLKIAHDVGLLNVCKMIAIEVPLSTGLCERNLFAFLRVFEAKVHLCSMWTRQWPETFERHVSWIVESTSYNSFQSEWFESTKLSTKKIAFLGRWKIKRIIHFHGSLTDTFHQGGRGWFFSHSQVSITTTNHSDAEVGRIGYLLTANTLHKREGSLYDWSPV